MKISWRKSDRREAYASEIQVSTFSITQKQVRIKGFDYVSRLARRLAKRGFDWRGAFRHVGLDDS